MRLKTSSEAKVNARVDLRDAAPAGDPVVVDDLGPELMGSLRAPGVDRGMPEPRRISHQETD